MLKGWCCETVVCTRPPAAVLSSSIAFSQVIQCISTGRESTMRVFDKWTHMDTWCQQRHLEEEKNISWMKMWGKIKGSRWREIRELSSKSRSILGMIVEKRVCGMCGFYQGAIFLHVMQPSEDRQSEKVKESRKRSVGSLRSRGSTAYISHVILSGHLGSEHTPNAESAFDRRRPDTV